MRRDVQQLPLDLKLDIEAEFENFCPGNNQPVVDALQWRHPEQFIFLWGGPGSGKTHLLQAACHAYGQAGQPAAYLPLAEIADAHPDWLAGMEQLSLVCIDDVHRVLGAALWESALFALFNGMRQLGHKLVMASSQPWRSLEVKLPDLASRLAWGLDWHLQPLNDEQKLVALQLRARRRGLELEPEVGRYVLQRWPRDLSRLFRLLDKLDYASLAQQRRLTIPFVKEVMTHDSRPSSN